MFLQAECVRGTVISLSRLSVPDKALHHREGIALRALEVMPQQTSSCMMGSTSPELVTQSSRILEVSGYL
jgi:hypothetical protein